MGQTPPRNSSLLASLMNGRHLALTLVQDVPLDDHPSLPCLHQDHLHRTDITQHLSTRTPQPITGILLLSHHLLPLTSLHLLLYRLLDLQPILETQIHSHLLLHRLLHLWMVPENSIHLHRLHRILTDVHPVHKTPVRIQLSRRTPSHLHLIHEIQIHLHVIHLYPIL